MENAEKFTTLIKNGQWYKGNTHTHSLISDGRCSYDEVIGFYKGRGYNFLAMTEHEIYTAHEGFDAGGFIVIPGMETAPVSQEEGYNISGMYHGLLLLAKKERAGLKYANMQKAGPLEWTGQRGFQASIDSLSSDGDNLVIMHCPRWNQMTPDDLLPYSGYCAIEIYNHVCQEMGMQGNAEAHWDLLIRSGRSVWGIASDDLHANNDPRFIGGGWIMAKATGLSIGEIAAAIERGSFYSTQGPLIYDCFIREDTIHLECSPVEKAYITFFGDFGDFGGSGGKRAAFFSGATCWGGKGGDFAIGAGGGSGDGGDGANGADDANSAACVYTLDKRLGKIMQGLKLDGTYAVRITLEDGRKNLAWANPIFVRK
ncbi:MAG: hypothetical protein LBL83_03535 [Clostridiales bacterium]|jgi:hypothetical protein|nr:hypothetical protein [Clostridiales bacterium]